VATPTRTCDGTGICQPTTPTSCAPYTCRPDAPLCRTDCSTPDDCVAGETCMGAACGHQQ
jgi:hypothetical protein